MFLLANSLSIYFHTIGQQQQQAYGTPQQQPQRQPTYGAPQQQAQTQQAYGQQSYGQQAQTRAQQPTYGQQQQQPAGNGYGQRRPSNSAIPQQQYGAPQQAYQQPYGAQQNQAFGQPAQQNSYGAQPQARGQYGQASPVGGGAPYGGAVRGPTAAPSGSTAPAAGAANLTKGLPVSWPLPTAGQSKQYHNAATVAGNSAVQAQTAAGLGDNVPMAPNDLQNLRSVIDNMATSNPNPHAAKQADIMRRLNEMYAF